MVTDGQVEITQRSGLPATHRSTRGLKGAVQHLAGEEPRAAQRYVGDDVGGRAEDDEQQAGRRAQQAATDDAHGREPVTQLRGEGASAHCATCPGGRHGAGALPGP